MSIIQAAYKELRLTRMTLSLPAVDDRIWSKPAGAADWERGRPRPHHNGQIQVVKRNSVSAGRDAGSVDVPMEPGAPGFGSSDSALGARASSPAFLGRHLSSPYKTTAIALEIPNGL
jgi:hypothetical protein